MTSEIRNRRSFVRKQIDVPVRVLQVLGIRGAVKDPKGYQFTGRDIGPAGMGLETDMTLKVGYTLRVEFVLAGESRKVRVDAVVRRIIPKGSLYPSAHPIYGLQFIRLSAQTQVYLTNYLTGTFLLV